MSSIRATTDRIIVLPDAAESTTSFGLVLPPVAQGTQTQGTVVSVGQGVDGVEDGDTVIYTEHAGASIQHEGTEHFSLHKGEVLAVVS
jgi:chaperonin GroES